MVVVTRAYKTIRNIVQKQCFGSSYYEACPLNRWLEVNQVSESKISDDLKAMISDRIERSPGEEIKVILTISKGVALDDVRDELTRIGLRIENMIPGPVQVITGSVSVKDISRLAEVGDVEKIEYDGMVYAL